jgi:hypothetical protein
MVQFRGSGGNSFPKELNRLGAKHSVSMQSFCLPGLAPSEQKAGNRLI